MSESPKNFPTELPADTLAAHMEHMARLLDMLLDAMFPETPKQLADIIPFRGEVDDGTD